MHVVAESLEFLEEDPCGSRNAVDAGKISVGDERDFQAKTPKDKRPLARRPDSK
jgi:hypothetical protein